MTTADNGIAASATEFRVGEGYRKYVLWLLFTVYVFNFVDRAILTILMQPIKEEFNFSDTEMGFLGGLAFALLYCTLGIPIARRADKANRVFIISLSLLVWSVSTVFTGFARNFNELLLGRVAVGIGEAGCSPPAYSLLSDYFEPKRRATALAIYSMGISGGVFLGLMLGGQVAKLYGWRMAFFVCGLPGVALALVVWLTLREPPRGFSDPTPTPAAEPPPMREVIARLWSRPTFRNLALAAALQAFVAYGVGSFASAFLMRSHAMTVAEAGGFLGLVTALGGATGTYFGGRYADRLSERHRDRRWQLWVPGIATMVGLPLGLIVYLVPIKAIAIWTMVPALALASAYLGPTYATVHGLVGVRERALAGAFMLFIINLIGLGLGPLVTGMVSDLLKHYFMRGGATELVAAANGLRCSLAVMVCVSIWSALHYMRAARTLREDLLV
jgi:predicted MFS family arabinose efflux permease